ncbi:MAG TPA: hypothetical protein DCY40_00780 [Actinobacteria bacterium]|nr:hypothetical protein [Actinomycetota bacterium]
MTSPVPKKFPLIPVIVGLGAVALIATVLLTMSSPATEGEFGTPAVTGTALPRAGANPDPALGYPIPEVVGADFDGTAVRISNDGRAKILVYLAHWCSVCQAEVPVVQDWVEAGSLPDNVDLIAVSTNTSSARANFPPSEWLEREGWSVPTIVDDEQSTIAAAFGLDAFPFFVFVSPDGIVVGRTSGALPAETLTEIATTLSAMVASGE